LRRCLGIGTAAQLLVGGLAIDRLLIVAVQDRAVDDLAPFVGRERTDAAARRADHRPLDNPRLSFFVEQGDQRLSNRELGDRLLDVELGILPQRLGGGLDRLLVARRERAQRVLDAVAELAEHAVRKV
jgi:hypothetical protein